MKTIKNIKLPDGETYKIGGGLDDKITNCITEIPQDIKLELNNGVLTLKAGSKVYVPNGFEADGTTPKFDEVVIENDVVRDIRTGTENNPALIFYKPSEQIIDIYDTNRAVSSNTDILATSPYHVWYDTNNNLCKIIKDNLSSYALFSLPIALCTRTNGITTSIDQTFNGFGYIGSTVYVLPNVKGLIPNGRNEDGSLNNIEITSQKVSIVTNAGFYQPILYVFNGFGEVSNSTTDYWIYDEVSNHYKHNNDIGHFVILAQSDTTNGVISNFQPKLPFRAVDYSDKPEVSSWSFPSNKYVNLALGASGTVYTAPANGWFNGRFEYSAGGHYQVNTGPLTLVERIEQGPNQMTFLVPIKKGEQFAFHYANLLTRDYTFFRFIYADGEV